MKILVTGATGFVGQHLLPELLAQGHEITAVARNRTRAQSFSWIDQVAFVPCDIHDDLEHAPDVLRQQDVAIHLAWPGLPNYNDRSHFERTLPADYRFIKWLVKGDIRQLLVTGTCLEYGMREGCLSERMKPEPQNPYAMAKDTLRKELEPLAKKNGIALQWARLFYMFGPGQNPSSLLAQLDQAIKDGAGTFNMSGGEQLRDYLPVEEVGRRLAVLAGRAECTGVVNICSGTPISVRRLVEEHLTKRKAHIALNLGYYPYPDYEPMAFWGDTRKFMSIDE